MPDRRKVDVPWNLNDKQAALEAKKKFCAGIDAAGRSPSPCLEIPEGDEVHHYCSDVTGAEFEHCPDSKRTRHISRISGFVCSDKAGKKVITTQRDEDSATGRDKREKEVNGPTPEANIESNMDVNEAYENAERHSYPVEKSAVILGSSIKLQNQADAEIGIDSIASKNTPVMTEVINVLDDSSSSSGSELGDEIGAVERAGPQVTQKPYQWEDHTGKPAIRSYNRITTSHEIPQSDFAQLVDWATRAEVNMVKETPGVENGKAHKMHTLSLPNAPMPRPASASFPLTRGEETHTPSSRGTNASTVPGTVRQPSFPTSSPLMETRVLRGYLSGHIKSTLSNIAVSEYTEHSPVISKRQEVAIAGSHLQASEVAHSRQALLHRSTIEPFDNMRRTKSYPGPSSTPAKMATYNIFPKGSNGIRKEPRGVRMVKEPRRIFKDLSFFFFPDNDVNQQRFMRIRKAMEYGATFVHPWTTGEGVTHIIVDAEMQYEDVLKHVKLEEVPDHITIVNQRYPSDCISNQILVDPKQKLYEVIRRRSRANSAKMWQAPQEGQLLVQEAPIEKSKEGNLQKSMILQPITKNALDNTRVDVEAVRETPGRRSIEPRNLEAATPLLRKKTRAKPALVPDDPTVALVQQIQLQIETLQGEMRTQRSNIQNAENAAARSNAEWTGELGIEDQDLIDSLRMSVKDRRQHYEKGLAKLEAQLSDLEKRRTELRRDSNEAVKDSNEEERSSTDSSTFSYNDSFVEVIQAVKAVAHLPVDSDSDEDIGTGNGDFDNDSDKSDDKRPAKRLKLTGDSAFQCMEKHDGASPEINHNAPTIDILEQMSRYYEGLGDHWRPLAYRRAITTLKKEPRKIISKDDAVRLPFVGERLAAKIEEIATTNRLRKLDNAKSDPVDKAIEIFRGIYGVGLSQATRWVNEGFRTLDDLCVNKVKLTGNQRIGIEHYDDLQTRIPRAEVAEHGRLVKEALARLDPAFEATIMGSYRRGASDSGDIDIIITKPGVGIQQIRDTVVGRLIPQLLEQGFLKFGLATGDETSGSKWHGCSCLPTSTVWRRIDFLFVPSDEMGAALIYFTGNDIFNRSMRLLASKKGMRLNQRGLYTNVLRGKQRQKVTEGELIEGKDEKRIFEILGVPYRPPEHRIC
ncbi:hypothetical protein FKW77_008604 [Venturia effusa]|uniref:DNA polymerase lambda n=1 Tax=Venturia effusa TaxID=50376 RepID=A0A517LG40_9PEZI|nr:hypothetical protein FKW77_008604 [Venturia effusa]